MDSVQKLNLALRGMNAVSSVVSSKKAKKIATKMLLSKDERKKLKARKFEKLASKHTDAAISSLGVTVDHNQQVHLDFSMLDSLEMSPQQREVAERFLKSVAHTALSKDDAPLSDAIDIAVNSSGDICKAFGVEESKSDLVNQLSKSVSSLLDKMKLDSEEMALLEEA